MINIVDARMGKGKTSAAIQYMNDHPEKRYLFITPFISETERIRKSCPRLGFWTPSDQLSEFEFRKVKHLSALINKGLNVALTHTLFKMCSNETAEQITRQGYVIFIDEVIDAFEPMEMSDSDIRMIVDSGWIRGTGVGEQSDYQYYEVDSTKNYKSGRYNELFELAKNHRLIRIMDGKMSFYFWTLNKRLLALSEEVYVLTYMFDGMPMKALLDICGLQYKYIDVVRDASGKYCFTDQRVPDYAPELKELIHICDNSRLNEIGDMTTALSATWTKNARIKSDGRLDKLRKNINTYFRHYVPTGIKADSRLWCTFKGAVSKVRDKGFYNNNLAFNARATNEYQDRSALAYCVNIYLNPVIQSYFAANGVSIDPDRYALAYMVQWLWRGCIRQGKEMWVYIPSRRMRNLLTEWLDKLSKEEIQIA